MFPKDWYSILCRSFSEPDSYTRVFLLHFIANCSGGREQGGKEMLTAKDIIINALENFKWEMIAP